VENPTKPANCPKNLLIRDNNTPQDPLGSQEGITWYTVIKKLGLVTNQAVDDFPLGSIQTTVWVCNQLDYQTNPCDIYLLFHLLILYYFFKLLLI
jgi:hypothetical protein